MRVRDLGGLEGPVWLFGGAYSNAQAVRAFLAGAAQAGVRPICTGDLVAYGADPVAVLEMLAERAEVIAGNVERQLAADASDCGCGFAPGTTCESLSRGWYAHARARVAERWRRWMGALPDMAVFTHEGRRWAVIHGGMSDISRFLWPDMPDDVFRHEINMIKREVGPVDGVVAGHCGIAFERRIGDVTWLNAGVIGLPPHDGRPETRFAVLGKDGARLHRLSYDHRAAAAAMRAAGLGQGYAETLETGLWPSQDVLPEALRRPLHPG